MKVRRTAAAVMILLLAASLAGCAGGTSKAANGAGEPNGNAEPNGSAATSATATTETVMPQAAPYVAVAVQSANEKKAVKNLDAALKAYVAAEKKSAAPRGAPPYVFENAEAYEPQLIGHQVLLLTGKQKNGTYGQATVVVLGDKVTTQAHWEDAEGPTKENGHVDLATFKVELPTDPTAFIKPLKPLSDAEQNAVARAKEWMGVNVSDLGFADAELVGFVFAYGQPGDRPNLVISIPPDGSTFSARQAAPE